MSVARTTVAVVLALTCVACACAAVWGSGINATFATVVEWFLGAVVAGVCCTLVLAGADPL